MAKHRQIPQHSLHARTVIGGVLASGALLVGAPAGMAFADHGTHGWNPPKPETSTNGTNGWNPPKFETRTNGAVTQDAAPKVTAQPTLETLKAKLTPEKALGQFINTQILAKLSPKQLEELGAFINSLPPEAQYDLGVIAADLGIAL